MNNTDRACFLNLVLVICLVIVSMACCETWHKSPVFTYLPTMEADKP